MKPERVNSEAIWTHARWPRPGEILKIGQPYLMDYNPRRGTKTVSILQADGVQAFYTIQQIPDSFLDDCKRSRERWSGMSSVRRNAAMMQPLIEIPDNIATNLYSKDGDGAIQLAMNDPERDKRLQKFANDRDYYKLRLSEGQV